ncbi:CRISPR-associated endonuclease/helicase Cas3 [Oceanospirillum multiglobuliferum]|uniref:Type I-F CRISPR-associated helicase Cas3 n=1 Tax=Oceanospirillum multiglobuliferum TaxID=64969 RepID=A0A1T4P288_9GAMM|nr:type I-F CRISPR-associated helicase Cas3f [Oceanospirillum multiglobuliferum]OPX55106.1 type I-F CRISPR-associated helicase Cas3 [Oceanospirillum multiglobuliferum]SJZ85522.1 CRISPR-associated endonuclease/helicase Cas3 [Oceanospirillum multiglobuliferum]
MMVTFVSQCEKKALPRTRRVLDAFANRIGDNTWQTLITEDGLLTVKKMLRQTASKSTAVSCHWIRSRSRSQLLWVVGNRKKFNSEGVVPVNRTEQDLPSNDNADNWRYLPLIKTFTGLAALLHDWGKATKLFQDKLKPKSNNKFKGDPLRHEWISSLLLMSLIRSCEQPEQDQSWLKPLIEQSLDESQLKAFLSAQKDLLQPFSDLPDAASLVLWLVLSHHRLPKPKENAAYGDKTNDSPQQLLKRITQQWGYENRFDDDEFQKRLPDCFVFQKGLLSDSSKWREELSNRARQLSEQLPLFSAAVKDGSWRTIAHHARLCLMLGDHYYSSKEQDKAWDSPVDLYANTGLDQDHQRQLKQKLDEHLVKVAEAAVKTCCYLPDFETQPPVAQDVAELAPKKGLSEELKSQFGWQDKAVTVLENYRKKTEDKVSGYFIVNMASTGRGKTLANAKIMQALSPDQQSLRFILALGLRTLTLQTGDEYRERIGLKDDELAVLIGSKAILELHQGSSVAHDKDEQSLNEEDSGSESTQPLLDPEEQIDWCSGDEHWQNLLPEEELTTVLTGAKERALLYAPVLACTIDHVMGATETTRGGRYILPSLRLMSSDLVIDEIDDFTGEDLVAIGRLIYLAGMLGRKVMISSATIPPDLALGYFTAYQKGWALFATSRYQNTQIASGWVDEFKTELVTINQSDLAVSRYQAAHQSFVEKRVTNLSHQPVKRRADILTLPDKSSVGSFERSFFSVVQKGIIDKHQQHHEQDSQTGRKISFGVVRCANIKPCVELTEYLLDAEWPEHIQVRVMAYHSQQVLLLRHAQEQHLDQVLKRKIPVNDPKGAFYNPLIRQHIDSCDNQNLIFILVATPVEEVGRDHDFDWAVVEPSSYRSIIQLAGRVRRHRAAAENEAPNMALMQYNLKGYRGESKDVFSRPGYEQGRWQLTPSKSMDDVLDVKVMLNGVDAVPRIMKDTAAPSKKLAALEHFVISRTLGCHYLTGEAKGENPAGSPKNIWGYTDDYWWMTALPQQFNRFRNSAPSLNLYRVIDDRGGVVFKIYDQRSGWVTIEKTLGIQHQPLSTERSARLWLQRDYEALVAEQCEQLGGDLEYRSKQLGELSLSFHKDGNRYRYNDQLGLLRADNV